ncbi:MAG: hypothetical protein AAF191_04035, partial [Verrucomicrobiota bacterium]
MKTFSLVSSLCSIFLFSPASASAEVTWRALFQTALESPPLLGSAEEFFDVIPPRATPVEGIRPFSEVLRNTYETFD